MGRGKTTFVHKQGGLFQVSLLFPPPTLKPWSTVYVNFASGIRSIGLPHGGCSLWWLGVTIPMQVGPAGFREVFGCHELDVITGRWMSLQASKMLVDGFVLPTAGQT